MNDSQGNVWRGGGGRKVFVYICKGVRRWAGAVGDLSPVDTVATGELQFFVPALHVKGFEEGERLFDYTVCFRNILFYFTMEFRNTIILKDGRTGCLSISSTVRIADYCDWFELIGKDNKLDEQRPVLNTRSGNMIRKRLIEDLKRGAVIPPIVVGLAVSEDLSSISTESVSSLFVKHRDDVTVIDGMQRSEALSIALAEAPNIADNLLRLDMWVARDTVSLVYRMLVLNTGQVPWDVKRQMEVIYKPLIKEIKLNVPGIIVNVKNDNARRAQAGEYQASSMVELFIAFTSRKEIVSAPDRIADDFIRLDVAEMAGTPQISSLFYRSIGLMVKLDQAFSCYHGDDTMTTFKNGKDIFTRNAAQAGFVVAIAQKAIGMPGMNPKDSSVQESIMAEIEDNVGRLVARLNGMNEDELSSFMSFDLLNELMSNLPTKKIGNAQREFFKACFKVLIETDALESMQVAWQSY